jgi:hypothetical protein
VADDLGQSQAALQSSDSTTNDAVNNLINQVISDFGQEPYAVNQDANGNYLGAINWPPYQPC